MEEQKSRKRWWVGGNEKNGYEIMCSKTGMIATVCKGSKVFANAKIIARAPDMRNALDAIHKSFDGLDLASIGTDEERKMVLDKILTAWNESAFPIMDSFNAGGLGRWGCWNEGQWKALGAKTGSIVIESIEGPVAVARNIDDAAMMAQAPSLAKAIETIRKNFGQHNLLTAATEEERKAALERIVAAVSKAPTKTEKEGKTMEKYDVHLIAAVRVKVPGVEAASHKEAMEKAERRVDLKDLFDGLQYVDEVTGEVVRDCIEYNEEIPACMVDVVGDEEYLQTEFVCNYVDKEEADGMLKALKAIEARIDGEFDNPALVKLGGALFPDASLDIRRIVKSAIAKAEHREPDFGHCGPEKSEAASNDASPKGKAKRTFFPGQ